MSEFIKETSEYVEMSDSITLCIVKDGAAGTSINMKTGVSSTDGLPTSGANAGDSYIIDGHLWTYTGTTVSDSTHRNGFTDCGKVSGEAGKNNYVHIAWSNTQNPTKDDIVLSNTDGNAYAYMGTWVSETKEDTVDEAVNMATWVYVKGDKGDSTPGEAATLYTIEAVGSSNNNSGTLTDDAQYIAVTLIGNLKLYKTAGSEKTEDTKPPQCWRLTIGGTNVDGTSVFSNSASNNIITYSYYNEYKIDDNGKCDVPGSATISVYKDNTLSEMIASLVIPISLNPGAIVVVNTELGTIQNTTTSLQGTIETIKQGQGQISLKVQSLQSMAKSRNLISGGNVVGLYNKKYEVLRSSAFKMEQGKTYTVTARLWLESASNGHSVIAFVFGADDNWTYYYSSDRYTNTSASVVRFKFTAEGTKQMVIGIYEQNSSGTDPLSYNGVHVDWVRVDEGDWTGDNGRTIDAWIPSEEEIDAVNLLPDPGFSEAIGYSDAMGERNSYDDNMGDYVSWMSRNSTSVDGACGVLFNRSGATSDTAAGLRYIVPFRGAGTYSISCFAKDLHQTNSYRPAWNSGKVLAFECRPMDANKTRITGGFAIYVDQNDRIFGDEQYSGSHTFGATATRDNGNGTTTEIEIAYLEVRVFLQRNGSVRVSRLCLSKSDHFIYWNVNEVSEARKKDAAQLATGIDIYSHKIIATTDNFTVRNNSGETTFSIDEKGNIVGAGDAYFKGTITGSAINGGTINGTTINGSTINSTDGTSTTKIAGGQITTNNINANGGNISFFNFDNAGMYSGSIGQDGKMYSGLGMSMNNLSVSGNNNRRISSVFLGNGRIDSRYSDNHFVPRLGNPNLGNTFYNYIKLERIGSGSFSFENNPEHAALGIETQGDFCLAALGGPSQFAGMCFVSSSGSTFTGDKQHTFYLCSGGTFTMPSDPPDGMLFIVIQTGSRITFNGNGHQFRSGTNYRSTCDSNTVGQWNLFYFDGSYWNTVYINGRPW